MGGEEKKGDDGSGGNGNFNRKRTNSTGSSSSLDSDESVHPYVDDGSVPFNLDSVPEDQPSPSVTNGRKFVQEVTDDDVGDSGGGDDGGGGGKAREHRGKGDYLAQFSTIKKVRNAVHLYM